MSTGLEALYARLRGLGVEFNQVLWECYSLAGTGFLRPGLAYRRLILGELREAPP